MNITCISIVRNILIELTCPKNSFICGINVKSNTPKAEQKKQQKHNNHVSISLGKYIKLYYINSNAETSFKKNITRTTRL